MKILSLVTVVLAIKNVILKTIDPVNTTTANQPTLEALQTRILENMQRFFKLANPSPEELKKLFKLDQFKIAGKKYHAEWAELDLRPLPEWYDKSKVGILVTWGLYSVPAYVDEWFWYHWKKGERQIVEFMERNYPPGLTYRDFAPSFTAENFDPDSWADLFKKSGAKYVILTSKHHDGFTLFPSEFSPLWNSVDIGPQSDLVGELAKAVRNIDLEFGIYYSLNEWFNPMYVRDRASKFTNNTYPNGKLWPEINQLITEYKPSIIWGNGEWEAEDSYWKSKRFLAWLYNESPVRDVVVVNDRWGSGISCHHGDFYTCDDRYDPGRLQNHKWESVYSLDKFSFCYRRDINIEDLLTVQELLELLVRTVSCGGNLLINVGARSDGSIAPIFQERLLALGKWLKTNGEAIYGTSPWLSQNDTYSGNAWYTCQRYEYNGYEPTAVPLNPDVIAAVYVTFFEWPKSNILILSDVTQLIGASSVTWQITMLGRNLDLTWQIDNGMLNINLPDQDNKDEYGWSLKFSRTRSKLKFFKFLQASLSLNNKHLHLF